MSDPIAVQLIASMGALLVAVVGLIGGYLKLRSIGADAAEARSQTKNSHGTNLRDDIDAMRREVAGVKSDVAGVHDELRGVRHDINGLRQDDGEIRRQMRIDAERAKAALKAHILASGGEHEGQTDD